MERGSIIMVGSADVVCAKDGNKKLEFALIMA
jgi:hypothetical protein